MPPDSHSNVRIFPLNIDLQLSNIINRKKTNKQTKKRKEKKLLLQCIRQFSLGTRQLPRTGWRGWRQSLIVQLRHAACRQRYVLRGFYAWYFFLWWAESCLSIWDVFTGSWALASFLLSQDCLTVEFCFEWSVFSNLCHKLWVLSARGKQGHRLCLTHAIGIHLIWKWRKDKDIAYDPLYWHSNRILMCIV